MSSTNAGELASNAEDVNRSRGVKRDASTLFVEVANNFDGANAEEDLESPDYLSTKQPRVESSKAIDDWLAAMKLDARGRVLPYHSEREQRPHLAIYHPSFQKAEQTVSDICKELITIVQQVKEDYDCDFAEIESICEQKLKPFLTPQAEYPPIQPVATLGGSGIGKSSFTGCILDNRSAAYESDGAKRGTSVVHEYCGASTDQRALFLIRATFLSGEDLGILVKTHCDTIFNFLSKSDDLDEDEDNELAKYYDKSIEFFQTVLCDQAEFESVADARAYFDTRADDREGIVAELTALIHNFKASRTLVDEVEQHEAESVGELTEIYKRLSRAPPSKFREPHPWPLLVKVETHQDKPLLNTGVVLSDCPGITDSNQSVVNATMSYLRRTGTILIFSKIERIEDHPDLDADIRTCLRLGKRSNVCLVVTGIDRKARLGLEERDTLSVRDQRLLEDAESLVENLETRRALLKQAKATATMEEYQAIDKEYEDLPKRIAMAEARIDQLNIEFRNQDVKEYLRNKIRQLERSSNGPDLPVFFVSNTMYQQHLKGYDPEKPPLLDIEGTGIPTVRRFLFEVPARGKSNTLQRICRTALPLHLLGIISVLTKSRLARKAEVKKTIEKVLWGYSALLDDLEQQLQYVYNQHISEAIVANESKWASQASKLIASWEKFKTPTFAAFCRRNGRWREKGQSDISWNNKIQSIFEESLVDAFNALDNAIAGTSTSCVSNINDLFSKLLHELQDREDFQINLEAKAFLEFIQYVRDDLNKEIRKLFHVFIDRVAVVRNKTILEDDNKRKDSYVSKAMQETYDDCAAMVQGSLKGIKRKNVVGVHARRVNMIRRRLLGTDGEKGVFAAISHIAKEQFERRLSTSKKECKELLESACQNILQDFDRRFDVNDVEAEEQGEATEVLKPAAIKAQDRTMGELATYVKEFVEYERSGGMFEW